MTPEDISGKLPNWLNANFVGCTPHELRQACLHLEIGTSAKDTIDSMTRKLLQHYNRWDVGVDGASPTPAKPKAAKVTKIKTSAPVDNDTFGHGKRRPPNLTSLRRWEGKRYRIRALPQNQQAGGSRRIPVPWEGDVFLLDPKLPYQDVPAPVFYNIADSQAKQLILNWNAQTKEMDRVWHVYARFPLQFLGVTPGTEHLPEDLREWLQRDAIAHDNYADEGRDTLERVWGLLTDGAHPDEIDRNREIGYWRRQVQQLLGLTPEQMETAEAEAA